MENLLGGITTILGQSGESIPHLPAFDGRHTDAVYEITTTLIEPVD